MRSTWCFSVHATSSPTTLPRVVDVIALFGFVPRRCHSETAEGADADMIVDLQLDGATPVEAASIAKRLGRLVAVHRVLVSEKIPLVQAAA